MADVPPSPEIARLLRDLAHEAGNALAAIRLTAQLPPRSGIAGQGSEASQVIEASCARAGALLAQIRPLLVPADDADRSRLGVDEIFHALEQGIVAPRARAVLEKPGADLGAVRADADALHHVLLVLVLEALERSPPEQPVVVAAAADRGDVVLSVEPGGSDEGVALEIAAAVLARDGGRLALRRGPAGVRVEVRLPALAPPA